MLFNPNLIFRYFKRLGSGSHQSKASRDNRVITLFKTYCDVADNYPANMTISQSWVNILPALIKHWIPLIIRGRHTCTIILILYLE